MKTYKIYENIEQGTDEWFQLRQLKMTASHASAIKTANKGLDTYIRDLVCESVSTGERSKYTNSDMQRGHDLEPIARDYYASKFKVNVEEVGFVESLKYDNVGVSPDGIIRDKKILTEFKAPNDKKYFNFLIDGVKDISSWEWQCYMQTLVMDYNRCDLCLFNPNFEQKMIIISYYPDKAKFQKLIDGFAKGNELIKEYKKKIQSLVDNV